MPINKRPKQITFMSTKKKKKKKRRTATKKQKQKSTGIFPSIYLLPLFDGKNSIFN